MEPQINLAAATDQEVVRGAREGLERAYGELVRRYERPIFSLIFCPTVRAMVSPTSTQAGMAIVTDDSAPWGAWATTRPGGSRTPQETPGG